ncbi:MAG: translation initiation factor Sui1 [Desulfobulbaceae bacterium]|nr:translation initiation factor Sui1 [Desulfobulbaceae bacterium]
MRKSNRVSGGMVYSTEVGRMCPGCGKAVGQCSCRRQLPGGKGDGIVRISRETKGRKGKGVTLITGLDLDQAGLKQMASRLKQLCGSGGSVRDGVIEIQGDKRDLLVAELGKQGYTVKRAGG